MNKSEIESEIKELKKKITEVKSKRWFLMRRQVDVYYRYRHSHTSTQCSACSCGEPGCTGWKFLDDYNVLSSDLGAIYSHTETMEIWVDKDGNETPSSPEEKIQRYRDSIAYYERELFGSKSEYKGPAILQSLK